MREVRVHYPAPIRTDRQCWDGYQLGHFIQYGLDVKRFGDEFLQVTSAVIEFKDGTIGLIPVKDVTFL